MTDPKVRDARYRAQRPRARPEVRMWDDNYRVSEPREYEAAIEFRQARDRYIVVAEREEARRRLAQSARRTAVPASAKRPMLARGMAR